MGKLLSIHRKRNRPSQSDSGTGATDEDSNIVTGAIDDEFDDDTAQPPHKRHRGGG